MTTNQIHLKKILYNLFRNIILIFSFIIVTTLSFFTLKASGYIKMTTAEEILFIPNGPLSWLILILTLITLCSILPIALKSISEESLFIFFCFLTLIIGFYLIVHVDGTLRSDPQYVVSSARLLNEGNTNVFLPEGLNQVERYLSIFPNQLGLVSFIRIFLLFTNNSKIIFFIQLLMVQSIIFAHWKITRILFKNSVISKLTILLSFSFFPLLFSILWIYGDIPGLFFLMFGIYFFVKYWKENSFLSYYLSILSLMISCLIRPNYQIFIIGIICFIVLEFLKNINFKKLIYLISLALLVFISPLILKKSYEKTMDIKILQGPPPLAWVVMGLSDNASSNGYWDGYTTFIYHDNEFDDLKTKEQVKKDFDNRLKVFSHSANYTFKFFTEKINVTWNEPTFMSIYAGPLFARGQKVESNILKSLYQEGVGYKIYNRIMAIFLSSVYILVFLLIVRLMIQKNLNDNFLLFPLIVLIGGFVFHLFWETKARYVIPYIFLLLPLVAYQIYTLSYNKVINKVFLRLKNRSNFNNKKEHYE